MPNKITLTFGLSGVMELKLEKEWGKDYSSDNSANIQSNLISPIYQFHAINHYGGGWRFYYSSIKSAPENYIFDGVAFYAYKYASRGLIPIYQLYAFNNINEIRYHYLVHQDDNSADGWLLDNIAFYAYKDKRNNTIPVYQYHAENHEGGWRFNYSINPNLNDGWLLDRIAFYSYSFINLNHL